MEGGSPRILAHKAIPFSGAVRVFQARSLALKNFHQVEKTEGAPFRNVLLATAKGEACLFWPSGVHSRRDDWGYWKTVEPIFWNAKTSRSKVTAFSPAKEAWPAVVAEIQENESASQKAVAQYVLTVPIATNLVAGRLNSRRSKNNGSTAPTDTAIWMGLARTKSP